MNFIQEILDLGGRCQIEIGYLGETSDKEITMYIYPAGAEDIREHYKVNATDGDTFLYVTDNVVDNMKKYIDHYGTAFPTRYIEVQDFFDWLKDVPHFYVEIVSKPFSFDVMLKYQDEVLYLQTVDSLEYCLGYLQTIIENHDEYARVS